MKEINIIADKLHDMHVKHGQLAWTKFTTGYDFGIEDSHKKMMDFMKDKNSYELILKYKNQDLEPLDQRRVDLMYKAFKPYNLSDEVNDLALKIQKRPTTYLSY